MKNLILAIFTFLFPFFFLQKSIYSETVLSPLTLDSPRSTLKNFMKNMNLYKQGLDEKDEKKIDKIKLAIKCLSLKDLPPIIRDEEGKEIAIFLKEVIDRVVVFSDTYEEIPSDITLAYWSIPETEITLQPEEQSGKKVFLFNPSTIMNAKEYFLKTKHLPYLPDSGKGANFSPSWREKISPSWSTYVFLVSISGSGLVFF